MLSGEQLKSYFRLISFEYNSSKQLEPTFELLRTLHEKHVFSIPFENLSIHFSEHIQINNEWILNKLTRQPLRGGYCHEMNGLFYEVLKTLGFDAKLYLSDVIIGPDKFRDTPEPGHTMLIVCIGTQEYLVDVGFGLNGLIHPLLLNETATQHIYESIFQVYQKDGMYHFGSHYNGQFHPEYRFNLSNPINSIELLQVESDKVSYKDVVFKNLILITKPTSSGRITLSDKQLRIIDERVTHKEPINSIHDFYNKLHAYFGIVPTDSEKELLSKKIRTPLQTHSYFSVMNSSTGHHKAVSDPNELRRKW